MKQLKAPLMLTILVVLIAALALSGCTSPTPTATPTPVATATPTPAPAGPTVLTVNGSVTTPLSLTLSDLKSYTQHNASWANNAGNATYNGTGPLLLDILNKAGLSGSATNITYITSDNYPGSITVSDLKGKYNDTIVAWDWSGVDKNGVKLINNGTLQVITPAGGNKQQAKFLVAITVS